MRTLTLAATEQLVDVDVIADLAPLGVQLWPTRTPAYADNFTLAAVAIVRDEITQANGQPGYVRWTYRNGQTRDFHIGEQVAARVPADALSHLGVIARG